MYIYIKNIYTYKKYIYTYIQIYIHIYVYICIYIYVFIYIFTYMDPTHVDLAIPT